MPFLPDTEENAEDPGPLIVDDEDEGEVNESYVNRATDAFSYPHFTKMSCSIKSATDTDETMPEISPTIVRIMCEDDPQELVHTIPVALVMTYEVCRDMVFIDIHF